MHPIPVRMSEHSTVFARTNFCKQKFCYNYITWSRFIWNDTGVNYIFSEHFSYIFNQSFCFTMKMIWVLWVLENYFNEICRTNNFLKNRYGRMKFFIKYHIMLTSLFLNSNHTTTLVLHWRKKNRENRRKNFRPLWVKSRESTKHSYFVGTNPLFEFSSFILPFAANRSLRS